MSEASNTQHVESHGVRITLLEHKQSLLEQVQKDVAASLRKLTDFEIQNRDLITEMRAVREELREQVDELKELILRVRKLEESEISREGLRKTMGAAWAAIIGLSIVEAWRFLSHIPRP